MGPKLLENGPLRKGGRDMKNCFQCSDCQSNTKNICTTFHEKILNSSHKMRIIRQNVLLNVLPKWPSAEVKMM